MGQKRFTNIKVLQAAAASGNAVAASALAAALFVPFHLRQSMGKLIAIHARRTSVRFWPNGNVDRNPVKGSKTKQGLHITAKTKKPMRSIDSIDMSPDYGMDRLQMLVDRQMRREARA
jgi:hypothetical protein